MVKIAIAGGSGNVGQEVIDALVATEKHEILLLSRKDTIATNSARGVTWVKVHYADPKQLTEVLQGVHTVLSFITVQSDQGSIAQKNLIDAAVQAGVKRFAPSEWATSSLEHLHWYAGKAEIREYLKELNKNQKILEYSLFQPGMFVEYYTFPHQSSRHVKPFETQIDFNNRRAIIVEGGEDDMISLTTAPDMAKVVARAVEYEGEWPVIGGIKGEDISIAQLIALGAKIRGGAFNLEKLKADDLRDGIVTSSWMPRVDHPAIPADQVEMLSKSLLSGILLGISAGVLQVSDEWNRLLPDYEFTSAERLLTEVWHDKS